MSEDGGFYPGRSSPGVDAWQAAFLLVRAFLYFLPAFVANPTAVLFGGGRPIDGGRVLRDGQRLFGDGKTWAGLAGGIASGGCLGVLISFGALAVYPSLSYGTPLASLIFPFLFSMGALAGDLLGSFLKRRMGRPKGAETLGLDQYDFVLGSVLVLLLVQPVWFWNTFLAGEAWVGFLFIIVITPFLHRAVNIIGYRMGKKEVPW